MADTVTSPRGAEISERSAELVLPEGEPVGAPLQREFGVSESEATPPISTTTARDRATASEGDAREHRSAALAGNLTSSGVATNATAKTSTPGASGLASSLTGADEPAATSTEPISATNASAPKPTSASAAPRGTALPGDRGPRNQAAQPQRPSFWRRIALGRRNAPEPPPPPAETRAPAPEPETAARPTLAERAKNAVAPAPPRVAVDTSAIENRIVEPMLQALVSVEAKLERSHGELVGRSDQVEQRLTQLWDIEEQLGTLSELQESLLQVSEQQRRLESAVVSQTTTLRWLVGAVFFSLAAAAFVVAAVLR